MATPDWANGKSWTPMTSSQCSGTRKVRCNADWSGYDSGFGDYDSYGTTASWGTKDGMSYNANVGIGPYSVIILSKD